MRLARLALTDFRNYSHLELEPQRGLNVFVGRNAQGKSNLLEAIAMLGVGKSFRTAHDVDTIRDGAERAVVRGEVERDGGEQVALACSIAKSARGVRKSFSRAGRAVPYAAFLGTLSVVTFVPSDLQLVTGTPALRRAFVNTALSQQDRAYYRELARYYGALRQKNAVLRDGSSDDELLAVYDETLASSGAALMLARGDLVARLDETARTVHASWTHGAETLALEYRPNVRAQGSTAQLHDAIAQRLREARPLERVRKTSVAGPHRDDLAFLLDGRPLATFGSQGQQRTAVLALKAAEYAVMRDRSGSAPLLLLDDLLSELDEQRAAAFLAGVGEYEQAYITATHRPAHLPERSALYRVEAATVSMERLAC